MLWTGGGERRAYKWYREVSWETVFNLKAALAELQGDEEGKTRDSTCVFHLYLVRVVNKNSTTIDSSLELKKY